MAADSTRARRDRACVEFLQWALPRMGLRWEGFRKVRRQVCKRLNRRLEALDLPDLVAYRGYLDAHPREWEALGDLVPITISRFYRDRSVFAGLEREVVPALAEAAIAGGRDRLAAWSAGCASGEEPYTVSLIWHEAVAVRFPPLRLEILATDVDADMLRRADAAAYRPSSLKDLPPGWRERGFVGDGELHTLRPELRRAVSFRHHDLRASPPAGPFDLILCRNVAFTYFAPEPQRAVLARLVGVLRPGGALVIGLHERLPEPAHGLLPWPGVRAVLRRACRHRG